MIIFPDTNLFLHYRAMNEIDWCSVLGAGEVHIKIAAVVTRELEERKDTISVAEDQRPGGRRVKIAPQVPFSTAVSRWRHVGVSDQAAHSRIRLLVWSQSANQGRPINPGTPSISWRKSRCILRAHYKRPPVKAFHYEIEVVPPNERLLLPPVPDEAEKKIKQLEAELVKYKLRDPTFTFFCNGFCDIGFF